MLSMGKTQPVRLEEMLRRTRENGEMKTWRQTLYHLALGPLDIINCSDPKDVETVLRDPYTFIKGQLFLENLGDFLGKGIFNSDGERWHAQRKTASHIFQVKNFRDVFSGDFVHEVDALCEHLAAASKANAVIDIQVSCYLAPQEPTRLTRRNPTCNNLHTKDLLLRATLDSFGRLAMGTDFGCIAQKPVIKEGRYMLPDVAFMEAFDYVNMVVSRRMTNPLWKFTEQRDGTTKKVREAQAVMFRFADQIIAEKREKMAKGETIDENGSSSDGKRNADMLDYFMRTKKQVLGSWQIMGSRSDRISSSFDGGLPDNDELRDVIMNVIIAGRDTTGQLFRRVDSVCGY